MMNIFLNQKLSILGSVDLSIILPNLIVVLVCVDHWSWLNIGFFLDLLLLVEKYVPLRSYL